MFGFRANWKTKKTDRLDRLAAAIEAIGERDRRGLAEADAVARLRVRGAMELHALCSRFVDSVNARLASPELLLDPAEVTDEYFGPGLPHFFQINLRGRLLQFQFAATEELTSREDFRRAYVLRGSLRSFNQETLSHSCVDEQYLFYCPDGAERNGDGKAGRNGPASAHWYFFDPRTHRSGLVGEDYIVSTFERLL